MSVKKVSTMCSSCAGVAVAMLLASQVAVVFAFPDGAPVDACVNKRPNQPNHNQNRPQALETSPYEVVASSSQYGPSSQITVTITGKENFKGFFIQARDVATDGWLGQWVETPNTNLHPECSAVTHADPREKVQATLLWQAPPDAQPGQVYFTGTVLKNYSTFWSNIVADVANV